MVEVEAGAEEARVEGARARAAEVWGAEGGARVEARRAGVA